MLFFSSKQPDTLADLLLVEVKSGWTRERVVIAAGDALPMGTVLVRGDDGVCNAPAAGDTDLYAVLAEAIPESIEPRKAVAIARGAALDPDFLQWPDGLAEADKVTLTDSLDKRGIVLRVAL